MEKERWIFNTIWSPTFDPITLKEVTQFAPFPFLEN